MNKFIFNCGVSNMESTASGKGLKRDLLAASIGILLARPALAAEPVDNEAQAEMAAATACAACHGEDGNMVPKLAGVTSEYFAKQLTEFMTGKRRRGCLRQRPAAA